MGTNMYPSSSLLDHDKEEHEALPVDELIEKADGFAGVFPGISLSSSGKFSFPITIIDYTFGVISSNSCEHFCATSRT